jgi:serine-type D-Ala-D-Ala carboxypeptidase (penicillin-binding protein 5/6)
MSELGPPPVPGDRPPGVQQAERSVLQGGTRRRRAVRQRRRGRGVLVALVLLLLAVSIGAGTYLVLDRDDSPAAAVHGIGAGKPAAGGSGAESGGESGASLESIPAGPSTVAKRAPRKPREPSPLIAAEPTPEIPLAGSDAFALRLRKPPRAALVFDVDTGEVLWRRRPLKRLPIASLTKIMTALVVTERTRPRDPVRITKAALSYSGSGVGVLPRGRRVRLETLLNGMLIVSGNDAAIALAVHVAGTERRFVRLMNQHARAWGLRCTHFSDSHGLGGGDRSCSRDLAVLTRIAMQRRRIARIVRRQQVSLRFPIKGRRLYLNGHNPLIRNGYRGAIGLKTGYTDAAGRCYVGVVRRAGRTLAVVLLHSPNPDVQAPKLLDRAFASVRAR